MLSVGYGPHVLSGFYEGRQTVSGSEKKLLIRRYKKSKTAAAYFQFLEKHKHLNLLEPLFHQDIRDETVIAFSNSVDCTLAGFLRNSDQDKLRTPPDHRYQQAFLDDMVSILRQLVDLMIFCHNNKIMIGTLSVDSIYLDLSGKNPRVLVLLPYYEQFMKNGERINDNFTLVSAASDLVNFGGFLNSVCMILKLRKTNAKEIFNLITGLVDGVITSAEEMLRHPAFISEEKKFPFLIDVYEHILRVHKDVFNGPHKLFPTPESLQASSWRDYFRSVIKKLNKKFRKEYQKGLNPDGFLNYCLFLRNVVIHIGSTTKLLKQFGNAGRFLRYARAFYPDIFIDLIYITQHYEEKAHILVTLTAG